MIFRTDGKEYTGATAVEIVSEMARDAAGFTAQTTDVFMNSCNGRLPDLAITCPPANSI